MGLGARARRSVTTLAIHIHTVPTRVEDTGRRETRWCFGCRARLKHRVVHVATSSPWYPPVAELRCSGCGKDRTAFPGCEP